MQLPMHGSFQLNMRFLLMSFRSIRYSWRHLNSLYALLFLRAVPSGPLKVSENHSVSSSSNFQRFITKILPLMFRYEILLHPFPTVVHKVKSNDVKLPHRNTDPCQRLEQSCFLCRANHEREPILKFWKPKTRKEALEIHLFHHVFVAGRSVQF